MHFPSRPFARSGARDEWIALCSREGMKTPSSPATPSTQRSRSTALGSDGKQPELDLPTHNDHALAEAGALGGAIAGGVIGAIAGPVGAIAGAAIGSAIGGFAGNTIDHDIERTSQHRTAEPSRLNPKPQSQTPFGWSCCSHDSRAAPERVRGSRPRTGTGTDQAPIRPRKD